MSAVHDRRAFMSRLVSATALAAAAGSSSVSAQTPPSAPPDQAASQTPPHAASKWDLTWIDELKGKHKQVYDYGSHDLTADPAPLRFVDHFLDAHKEVLGIEFPEVNAVIGTMFSAFPINASDAVWEKYKIGERWNIIDPATKAPAVRNIYLEDRFQAPGVKKLQRRGVVFWQCNVALGKVVVTLAKATELPPRTVRADLIAGFNPGVRLVPSHVMVVNLVQEHGFTYLKP